MMLETVGKSEWKVHTWVLMGNHSHLLVQTQEPNLVKGMTWVQTTDTLGVDAKKANPVSFACDLREVG